MPKDIYEFAYASRAKVLGRRHHRTPLLDDRALSGARMLTDVFGRFAAGATYLPREAWESARVA